MNTHYHFSIVQKTDADKLLQGKFDGQFRPFVSASDLQPRNIGDDEFVAVFRSHVSSYSKLGKPCVLAFPNEKMRELLAWTATYQADFSPISQWCRVIDTKWLSGREIFGIEATLNGLEAAWAGAIIGEIIARRGVDLSEVSLVWCLSSGTFAFARAVALWPDKVTPDKILQKIAEARNILKAEARRELRGLSDVWRVLLSVRDPNSKAGISLQGPQRAILAACQEIQQTGRFSGPTADLLSEYCVMAKQISEIDDINAEDRVRLIDSLVPFMDEAIGKNDSDAHDIISFLLGYAIGRVGAGEANLQLLLPFNDRLPMAAVWCPAIAALYQPIAWSSALDGLGRLVVKELTQPLHLDEAPRSDISLDELRVMINPQVQFKRLPFRPASNRVAMVELFPGVELAVNLRHEWNGRPVVNVSSKPSHLEPRNALTSLARDVLELVEKFQNKSPSRNFPPKKQENRGRTTEKKASKRKPRSKNDDEKKLI